MQQTRTPMNTRLSEKDVAAVQDIIMEQLDLTREQVTPKARIIEDLNADSLDVIEISMILEERFDISISDEGWDRVQTVEDVFDAVASLLKPS